MHIDVQFSAAHNDWPTLRDAVLNAEADGVNATWVFDHFDGSTLGGDRPVLECFTLIGALAAATSTMGLGTIGLGTMVANVANRHPAVLAHCALAAQRISGGRFLLGVGGGTAPSTPWAAEHERRGIALNPNLAERQLAVVDAITHVRNAVEVPIIVGVNSTTLAVRAGQVADGINVRLSHPRAAEFIAAARDAADGRPFEVSAYTMAAEAEAIEAAHALSIDRLILARLRAE